MKLDNSIEKCQTEFSIIFIYMYITDLCNIDFTGQMQ